MLGEDRTESLKRMIPELFEKKCLYIGARDSRIDYYNDFEHPPVILEVWEPNAKRLIQAGYKVINMDVRNIKTGPYEVVFWWHGPEHISKNQLREVLLKLEKIATYAVVLGCPWGYFSQGAIEGNPYERHISHWSGWLFEQLGYKVERLGTKDKRGSNITAVKYV